MLRSTKRSGPMHGYGSISHARSRRWGPVSRQAGIRFQDVQDHAVGGDTADSDRETVYRLRKG